MIRTNTTAWLTTALRDESVYARIAAELQGYDWKVGDWPGRVAENIRRAGLVRKACTIAKKVQAELLFMAKVVQTFAKRPKVLQARYAILTPPSDRPTNREAQIDAGVRAWWS